MTGLRFTGLPETIMVRPKVLPALCRDGTYSFSQHHDGTCSHHGGVERWEEQPRANGGGRDYTPGQPQDFGGYAGSQIYTPGRPAPRQVIPPHAGSEVYTPGQPPLGQEQSEDEENEP